MRKYLLIGVSAFVLGAGSMAYVSQAAHATVEPRAKTYRMLELFGDVLDTVERQYVTPVDDTKLIESALDGMLTSLDPHSGYLSPDSFEDMQDTTRGEYGGLGIEITSEDGVVKVISPMDDSPASRAGVQAGDYITAVNGESVLGMSVSDAVKQMRGRVGETVTLTIAREKSDPFDVKLTREVIKPKAATARMEGEYGYVRLSSFNEKATDEVQAAVEGLKAKNPHMKGVVFDLRNNPGGLLDQAIAVSDAFLERGEIVSTRGRRQEDAQRYNARPGDLINGLPLVVLINGGSASASEIVAGALQDHRRAIILGTRSFGKGSVQTIMPLGNQGAIRLTTARYFTPSGRSIQGLGIDPDIQVEQARLTAIDQPRMRREADLRGALSNPTQQQERQPQPNQPQAPQEQPTPATPGTPATPPAAQPAPAPTADDQAAPADAQQDYQLSRALDLLRGIALYSARAAN